jgi:hypothetical protein
MNHNNLNTPKAMAKLKQGIFGPISGKLGSLVGSSWMGIPYLKKVPKVNKNLKRSPAQLANNQKFAYVNDWLIPFHAYLTIGFNNLAVGKTAIGAALSAVYKTVFTGTMPDIEIDYSKMQISSGSLRGLSNVSITYTADNRIYVVWNDNPGPGVKFDDQVMLVLYNEEFKMTEGFNANVNRAKKGHNFLLSKEMAGQTLHAYIAVVANNRKKASNTIYLGQIKPA